MSFYIVSDTPEVEPTKFKQNAVVFSNPVLSSYPPDSLGKTKIRNQEVFYNISQGRINFEVPKVIIETLEGSLTGPTYTILAQTSWSSSTNYLTWWHFVTQRTSIFDPNRTYNVNVPLYETLEIVPNEDEQGTSRIEAIPATLNIPINGVKNLFHFYNNNDSNYIMLELKNTPDLAISRIFLANQFSFRPFNGDILNNLLVYGNIEPSMDHPLGADEQKLYDVNNPTSGDERFSDTDNMQGVIDAPGLLDPSDTLEGLIKIPGATIDKGYIKTYDTSYFRGRTSDGVYFSFSWPVQPNTVAKYGKIPIFNTNPFANRVSDNPQPFDRYDISGDGYLDEWFTDSQGIITVIGKTYNPIMLSNNLWVYTNITVQNWKQNDEDIVIGGIYETLDAQDYLEYNSQIQEGHPLYGDFDYLAGVLDKRVRFFSTPSPGAVQLHKDAIPIAVEEYSGQVLNGNVQQIPYIFVRKTLFTTLQQLLNSNTTLVYVSPKMEGPQHKAPHGPGKIRKNYLIANSPEQDLVSFYIINGYFTTYTSIPNSNYFTVQSTGLVSNNTLYFAEPNTTQLPSLVMNQIGVISLPQNIFKRWNTNSNGTLNVLQVYPTTLASEQFPDVAYSNQYITASTTQLFDISGNIIKTTEGSVFGVSTIEDIPYRWEINTQGIVAPVIRLYNVNTLQIDQATYADSGVISNITKLYTDLGVRIKALEGQIVYGLIADGVQEYRYEINEQGVVKIQPVFLTSFNAEGSVYATLPDNLLKAEGDGFTIKLYKNTGELIKSETEDPIIGDAILLPDYYYVYEIDELGDTKAKRVYKIIGSTNPYMIEAESRILPYIGQEFNAYYMNNSRDINSEHLYTANGVHIKSTPEDERYGIYKTVTDDIYAPAEEQPKYIELIYRYTIGLDGTVAHTRLKEIDNFNYEVHYHTSPNGNTIDNGNYVYNLNGEPVETNGYIIDDLGNNVGSWYSDPDGYAHATYTTP